MRHKKNKIICFIDDDENELERFRKIMENDYNCIIGQSYKDCVAKLENAGLKKPHLWIVDLFFPKEGNQNSLEEIQEMNDRYAKLRKETLDFRNYLNNINQDNEGGLRLLERCKKNYHAPVIMFTRKGTLDDAILCMDKGADAILRKPMPDKWSENRNEQKDALDQAMLDCKKNLIDKFEEVIERNKWWHRYKAKLTFVVGTVLGYFIEKIIDIVIIFIQNISVN